MKLLNQVAITVIAGRLESLQQLLAGCDEGLKQIEEYGITYGRGFYIGSKSALQGEILFLESLSAMLSNTPEPSAKIENPEGDGTPTA